MHAILSSFNNQGLSTVRSFYFNFCTLLLRCSVFQKNVCVCVFFCPRDDLFFFFLKSRNFPFQVNFDFWSFSFCCRSILLYDTVYLPNGCISFSFFFFLFSSQRTRERHSPSSLLFRSDGKFLVFIFCFGKKCGLRLRTVTDCAHTLHCCITLFTILYFLLRDYALNKKMIFWKWTLNTFICIHLITEEKESAQINDHTY